MIRLYPSMNGSAMIWHERFRQVSEEGWTPEHDLTHSNNELIRAARCYLMAEGPDAPLLGALWPWIADSWKPRTRIANLVRAGALLLAEYDRDVVVDVLNNEHRNVFLPYMVEGIASEIDGLLLAGEPVE